MQFLRSKIARSGDFSDMPFGTLKLYMKTQRQRMERINIGIFDARSDMVSSDVLAFASWIVEQKIVVLTGAFHKLIPYLHRIAIESGAVGGGPLYQPLSFWHHKKSLCNGRVPKLLHSLWVLQGNLCA